MEDFNNSMESLNLSVEEGNALVIQVPYIDSYPRPSFTWRENSQGFADQVRHYVSLNGTLVLFDRQISDSNHTYQVVAVNGNVGYIRNGPSIIVTVTGMSY